MLGVDLVENLNLVLSIDRDLVIAGRLDVHLELAVGGVILEDVAEVVGGDRKDR